MQEYEGRTIRDQIYVKVAPQQAWEAWVQASKIRQWYPDRADQDAREGEVVTHYFDDFEYALPMPVLEAKPGESLVFGGELPGRPPFRQSVRFHAEGEGTRMELQHSGFEEGAEHNDFFEGCASGWNLVLACCKHWLENHQGRSRLHVFRMQPCEFEYASVQPFFRTAHGLQTWFARQVQLSAEPLEVGSSFAIQLMDGQHMQGEVVASTPRELHLSWREENALITLKAFALQPGKRAVGLDFNAWDPPNLSPGQIGPWLERSLEVLAQQLLN